MGNGQPKLQSREVFIAPTPRERADAAALADSETVSRQYLARVEDVHWEDVYPAE